MNLWFLYYCSCSFQKDFKGLFFHLDIRSDLPLWIGKKQSCHYTCHTSFSYSGVSYIQTFDGVHAHSCSCSFYDTVSYFLLLLLAAFLAAINFIAIFHHMEAM